MILILFNVYVKYVFNMHLPKVSKAACILTTQTLMKTLRSKEAAASVNVKTWPTIIDTGKEFRFPAAFHT